MIRRVFLALGLAAALALPAPAQDAGDVLAIEVADRGTIEIRLRPDLAPRHVERLRTLAEAGAYDGVAFHRVIEGFMAQTGDVAFGTRAAFGSGRAGTGGSDLPDLPAEFSDAPFDRGVVGMARSADPDSANSQFFITLAPAPHLDGQYTVVGVVVAGQEVVDGLARGEGAGGAVAEPDFIDRAYLRSGGG